MPLAFKQGKVRQTLGMDGSETYDVLGERRPGVELILFVRRQRVEKLHVPR